MTYDGLDRLTDATSPMYGASGAHYTYDVLDNVTRIIAPGRDQAYCYDVSWRLTNVKVSGDCSTGSTILGTGFDVQGNLANWNGVAYTFDYGNRLRAIAGLEAYRYDAWGRRTRSSSTAGLVESLYGRDGQLLYQRDARTSRRRQYVYLAGSLVAEHDRPLSGSTVTVTYQHTDALGSPVATTDAAKAVLQRSEYEPYGKLLNRPLEDGPAYTGHVSDAATNLVYMQQRYYDPRTARFWSVDPVTVDSAGGNFNRYWYANDNPYRFVDPDGRDITSANPEDNAKIERLVNGLAAGTFKFDKQNKLQLVKKGPTDKKSSTYAKKLVAAINGKANVKITIASGYESGGAHQQVSGGETVLGKSKSDDINVYITGRSFQRPDVKDSNGNQMVFAPQDILMHELTGHAIPAALGRRGGNAVGDENAVRSEIPGMPLRAPDPTDSE